MTCASCCDQRDITKGNREIFVKRFENFGLKLNTSPILLSFHKLSNRFQWMHLNHQLTFIFPFQVINFLMETKEHLMMLSLQKLHTAFHMEYPLQRIHLWTPSVQTLIIGVKHKWRSTTWVRRWEDGYLVLQEGAWIAGFVQRLDPLPLGKVSEWWKCHGHDWRCHELSPKFI